jgi:hypothetical protein
MIFARLIGILTTITLILIVVFIVPKFLGLLIMSLLGGYKGLFLTLLICVLPVTTFNLQKAARISIESESYSNIYPNLIIFVINIAFLLIVSFTMQFAH